MEWSRDLVLQLVDVYRANPMLWDPTNPSYKDRNKKCDAWKAIGAKLNVDRLEAMKKIDTLTAQFRRELRKMKDKSGSGSDEVYKGNWFAFNSLTFLMDKMKPRSTSDAGMKVSNMSYRQYLLYIVIVCVVCSHSCMEHVPDISADMFWASCGRALSNTHDRKHFK
ncbi:hypothetical protein Pcinc_043862 [Petrolisthes cinctipes]|uniref:MADF domain-containing protein n=1 Tax=Petrolisthes cinctipes TaxID=88211 RepID=A0AAE1BID2_PETCI|nr:hypothetical protein Pcinc_043862 [Petrolisthes cinctipes]